MWKNDFFVEVANFEKKKIFLFLIKMGRLKRTGKTKDKDRCVM